MGYIIMGVIIAGIYFKWIQPVLKSYQPKADGTPNPKATQAQKTYIARALQKQAIASCKWAKVNPDFAIKINEVIDLVLMEEEENGK